MKKTLTVNLNNSVFNIDDDAYEMLQTYLAEIANHFKLDEEKTEIMADIEARIAELFTEKLDKNKNVINSTDVDEIIEIMGNPSQYADNDEDAEAPKSEKKTTKSRRFYRDPENAILGGIAGGLSAYLGMDVTLIRFLLIILVIFGAGFIIPVYIIMWFVAPEAKTVSQRLEMQGEDVTIETIKAEMNNAKNYVESDKFKQTATSVGMRIGEVLRKLFKILFGFVGAVLGLAGIIVIGVLISLLFVIAFQPEIASQFAPDFIANSAVLSPDNIVLLIVSLLLVVGCPIFILIYWVIRLVSGRRNHTSTVSWVVLVLWLAGLFMFYSIGTKTFIQLNKNGNTHITAFWTDDIDAPLSSEKRICEPFHTIDVSGNVELNIEQSASPEVTVTATNNQLAYLVTTVENGVLIIYSEKFFWSKRAKIDIKMDTIRSIFAKGACKIENKMQMNLRDFSLDLAGASKANLDMNVSGSTYLDVSGASEATITGQSNSFEVLGSGASKVKASTFIVKKASVDMSGASEAQVNTTDWFDATASGASTIRCEGSPKKVTKNTSGASSIVVE